MLLLRANLSLASIIDTKKAGLDDGNSGGLSGGYWGEDQPSDVAAPRRATRAAPMPSAKTNAAPR